MKVLKFGGSSVATAANIRSVMEIIREQLKIDKLIVVVSALGGTTDDLLKAGNLAASGLEDYKEQLAKVEQRHLTLVKELLPVQQQSSWLSMVKKYCNEIEDLCNGLFLLSEFTARSRDKLLSYGELMSSQIIAAAFAAGNIPAKWKDARELVRTNAAFGNAIVDFDFTNNTIITFFGKQKDKLFIVPGFIASNEELITTTLGRGGSDYTAAIIAAAMNASALEI